jgi:predicted enzyme related to lactoylglutathione lyase
MIGCLSHVTVLVRNQDEALGFYREKFGFEVVEDTKTPWGGRWLTIAPKGCKDVQVVLEKPEKGQYGDRVPEMERRVGQGTTWAYRVGDCQKECDELVKKGVKINKPPMDLGFAIEAIIEDLYGNPIILMQPR